MVKRRVELNWARSEVAGSQTNVVLRSTSEEHSMIESRCSFMLTIDRQRVTMCKHLKIDDDDEIFVNSVDQQHEAHLRETRLFACMPISPLAACIARA